jgi:hypothetical protein
MYKTINEAHGLAPADVKRVKDLIDMFEDKEIKRILKFLVKSNVEVDKTQDVTKMKKENKHPMKITRKNLKKIIEEEVANLLQEQEQDPIKAKEEIIADLKAKIKAEKDLKKKKELKAKLEKAETDLAAPSGNADQESAGK